MFAKVGRKRNGVWGTLGRETNFPVQNFCNVEKVTNI
jgi:hypothetical protein